jgi:hypothetical protein
MSVKRYKLALPSSSQRIRKAKESLREMPRLKQIELMVKAGAMTEIQAEKARKKLGEVKIVNSGS